MPPVSSGIFEFSVFKFDTATGDLMRNDRKVRISEQAARVLTVLLERAGTMVAREDLRQLLWPSGEFVDYDHSINNIVSQLRYMLRDDSRTPCLIETIPKRGYRFIGEAKFTPAPRPQLALTPDAQEGPGISADEHPLAVPSEISTSANDIGAPADASRSALRVTWLRRPSAKLALISSSVLLLVLFAVVFAAYHRRETLKPDYVYMGVAPFEVAGNGAEELAESFRIDLTDAVSQLPSVRVRAAHSFANLKQDDANIRNVAQALGLDTLILGKFTLQGNQCTLQFELVRGRDASHLASFRYVGTKEELSTIRDRAQRDIFNRLELTGGTTRPAPGSTANPRAYEAYLRGRYYLSLWRDESLKHAVHEFESAIKEDPGFAKAYAGEASTYMVMADHAAASPEESYSRAEELASKAVQMDPSMAEAHAMIGYIALHRDWNFEVAEKELRRAVELDPGQAIYHLWFAQFLTVRGRFEEGLQQVDIAHAADPFWPPVYMTEIYAAYAARQHPRAMAAAQKLTQLMPDWPLAYNQRGWLYWYSGHYLEAIAEWRQMAVMEKDAARIELEDRGREAFRKGGVRAYAQLRLEVIDSHTKWAHALTDFVPSEWYVYAGQRDKALTTLEDLINRRDLAALQMAVNPAYSDLYSDPRFHALLSRVGLALPRTYSRLNQVASK